MITKDSDNKVEAGDSAQAAATTEESGARKKGNLSRRKFLQILGATPAAATLAGCADRNEQKVFPMFSGDADQIPGVPTWYNSTCTECSAGCGIQVKTREGRAIKIEGNRANPINRGGLCALGQASLQSHYDPDRVRQPMVKDADAAGNRIFKPISWNEAFDRIGGFLNDPSKQKAIITGEHSGATEELLAEFSESLGFQHAVYESTQPSAVARAAELVYGTHGIPTYSFDKAEVILNFGADFLETWVSPCEYARDWSRGRKGAHPARFIHVEPRLSLTGANADHWLMAKPGTELSLALILIKLLLEQGRGANLREDLKARLEEAVSKVDLQTAADETGIGVDKILLTANYLREAKSSLVIAGGAATATGNPLALLTAVNFLNSLLMNVGNTVNLAAMRQTKSSLTGMRNLIARLEKGEISLLIVDGSNPIFSLPSSYGLPYGVKKVSLVVSLSSHLDETSQMADLILPSSSSLESWSDVRVSAGHRGLVQPAMTPLYDTKAFGDLLIEIASRAGKSFVPAPATGAAATADKGFLAYLKNSWRKVHADSNAGGDFDSFWASSVERGGYFDDNATSGRVKVEVSQSSFDIEFKHAEFDHKELSPRDLVLLPYPSVKSFDGRAANRPWLQELPDPITQIVWDSWAEIHPSSAKERGIVQGDMVTIRNHYGEVNVPAYLTEYVHPGVVAVPIGQGHTGYGRFAKKVGGGNVMELLPPIGQENADGLALFSTRVKVLRGRGKAKLVIASGSNSQLDRGLARTSFLKASAGAAAAHGAGHHGQAAADNHGGAGHGDAGHGSGGHGGHGGHEPKQMYVQREHPVYRWGMAIDLAACTGCSACVVACYAENNIPVVGKEVFDQGRELSWLRIERYYDGSGEEMKVSFLPMLCQHCGNAPCEPVCPVYAAYHTEEGLNAMVYNRCVGTRYCANNCSYKVRRFNWFEYEPAEPLNWQFNPDVTKRGVGVMEKCTFCVQRINAAKDTAKDLGRLVRDGDVQPACVQSCPTEALTFGNLKDPNSQVSKLSREGRAYKVLDHHLNTQPAISYLEDVKYRI